jgi:carbon-monoxide dehydrogenase large subunit
MEADSDGTIILSVGSSAIGQGLETIFGQIAADALDVPMDRIRVLHGSTTLLAEGFGSYGSRSTVMGGNAVVATANAFLAEFRKAAAERLRVKPDDLTIAGCVATAPDGSHVGLAELASARIAVDGLFANSKATYTYGTAAAHVAVDPKTGKVDVLDYIVVDDVGRIINPLTLHGQVIGAAVQGLGSVFTEEIVYDRDGQLLIGSLADYMVPVSTDYPHVRAVSLEEHPCPNNPLGTKGAGEGGIIPVAAAVVNAIAAALSPLGVEPRDLPITPPRLWDLIQAGRKD